MKRLAISIGIGAMAALLLTVGGASGKGGPDPCEDPTVEGGPNADFFGTEDIVDGDIVATYRGRDEVRFWAADVTVCMGGGDDRVRQGNANDAEGRELTSPFVLGGRGDDDLRINTASNEEPVEIAGESGDDILNGNRGFDRFDGGSGADVLLGYRRKDKLHGGTGDDFLIGGRGRDALFGDRDADTLSGNQARDLANGGGGFDRCAAEIRKRCEDTVQ
jgi:Ca2+-binding RTX toxin-like protein